MSLTKEAAPPDQPRPPPPRPWSPRWRPSTWPSATASGEAVVDASFTRAAGRGVRLPGPQRRRQDHHHPDDRRAGAAHAPGACWWPGATWWRDREAALRRMGCIVESPDFYDYLTGRENLLHFARMIDRAGAGAHRPAVRAAAHPRAAGRPGGDLFAGHAPAAGHRAGAAGRSGGAGAGRAGQRPGPRGHPRAARRCCAGWPTSAGIAVFVSSHLLGEVEKVCDRIAIVHRGRVLAEGSVAELTAAGRTLAGGRLHRGHRRRDGVS